MNEPTQQTIPGLPQLNRRKELEAGLKEEKDNATAAAKEMREAAAKLAELAAAPIAAMPSTPPAIRAAACAWLAARDRNLAALAAAGKIAHDLAAAIAAEGGAE